MTQTNYEYSLVLLECIQLNEWVNFTIHDNTTNISSFPFNQ